MSDEPQTIKIVDPEAEARAERKKWKSRPPTYCPHCPSDNAVFERFDRGGEDESFFYRHEEGVLTGMADSYECVECGFIVFMTRKKVEEVPENDSAIVQDEPVE